MSYVMRHGAGHHGVVESRVGRLTQLYAISHPIWNWGKGKPFGVIFAGIEVVAAAGPICDLLRLVRREVGSPVLAREFAVEDWQSCYRHPQVSLLKSLRAMPHDPDEGIDWQVAHWITRWQMEVVRRDKPARASQTDVQMTNSDVEFAMEAWRITIWDRIRGLDATFHKESSEEDAAKAISDINLRFHMEVGLPVVVEYQETADMLLARAISRDWDALEKLAKIDKWVTRFPEIYCLEDTGNQADAIAYELATRATKERPPTGQLDPAKVNAPRP